MRVEIIVQAVPATLREAIAADAEGRNVSLNEAAVSVLADRFGVAREPSGVPFTGASVKETMLLSVPDELRRRIRLEAAAQGVTMRGTVLKALAQHYGISGVDAHRRPRNGRPRAAGRSAP